MGEIAGEGLQNEPFSLGPTRMLPSESAAGQGFVCLRH